MTYEQLAAIAAESGFTAWALLDISTIEIKPEVREMCVSGTCRKYNKCWSCPPACGTLEEGKARLQQYSFGILVQTTGDIEDSFDIEAMQEIEEVHKEHFFQMQDTLRRMGERILPISVGGCKLCEECTYPDAPCRFPEKMSAAMSSYGMVVLEVCKANGLKYYYGSDKMSYTSCFLV